MNGLDSGEIDAYSYLYKDLFFPNTAEGLIEQVRALLINDVARGKIHKFDIIQTEYNYYNGKVDTIIQHVNNWREKIKTVCDRVIEAPDNKYNSYTFCLSLDIVDNTVSIYPCFAEDNSINKTSGVYFDCRIGRKNETIFKRIFCNNCEQLFNLFVCSDQRINEWNEYILYKKTTNNEKLVVDDTVDSYKTTGIPGRTFFRRK